jgi:anti-sigma factor RsiW
MKCSDVIGLMGPYIDSELEPTCTFRIQEHLLMCSECRTRYAQEEELERRMASALNGPPSETDEMLWQSGISGIVASPIRVSAPFSRLVLGSWTHAGWFSLVASLLFLTALACAGLGLRHRYPLPAQPLRLDHPAACNDPHSSGSLQHYVAQPIPRLSERRAVIVT